MTMRSTFGELLVKAATNTVDSSNLTLILLGFAIILADSSTQDSGSSELRLGRRVSGWGSKPSPNDHLDRNKMFPCGFYGYSRTKTSLLLDGNLTHPSRLGMLPLATTTSQVLESAQHICAMLLEVPNIAMQAPQSLVELHQVSE